jgi:hypothetical protein
MNVFMIRDKKTGLFSTAGRYAEWAEQIKGKIWVKRENAQQAIDYYERDEEACYKYTLQCYESSKKTVSSTKPIRPVSMYKDAEIVEFAMTEV